MASAIDYERTPSIRPEDIFLVNENFLDQDIDIEAVTIDAIIQDTDITEVGAV